MNRSPSPLWLKAALLGSTWASIEIILGSFLHNLRLPFVGALLAAIGASLMVAGYRLWPERGLLWRAAVICALMKSISPSALIMGPMIGIASEGFALELFTRLLGSSPLVLVIGAAFVATLPLIQNITNLLILYGFDMARLYAEVYTIAAKNLRIESTSPFDLILIVAAIHALLGMVAGLVGISVATRARSLSSAETYRPGSAAEEHRWWDEARGSYSFMLLVLHAAALPAGLLLLRIFPLWAGAVAVVGYGAGCFLRYPSLQKRFGRWKLWVEFAVITALAGLALKGIGSTAPGWQFSGLMLGFQMIIRAGLVLLAFSAIAHELRNPVIIAWMLRRGLGELTGALEVGFQSLPVMISALGEEKQFFRQPVLSLARMLKTAASLLPEVMRHVAGPEVVLIVGAQGSGKTTLAMKVMDELRQRNVRVGGIAAPGTWKDGTRSGFDVVDVRTGIQTPLCAAEGIDGNERIGPFVFSEAGLTAGRTALSEDAAEWSEVLLVDEVGPLELQDGGWGAALRTVVGGRSRVLVLTVRPSAEEAVCLKWNLEPVKRFDVMTTHSGECVQVILDLLR